MHLAGSSPSHPIDRPSYPQMQVLVPTIISLAIIHAKTLALPSCDESRGIITLQTLLPSHTPPRAVRPVLNTHDRQRPPSQLPPPINLPSPPLRAVSTARVCVRLPHHRQRASPSDCLDSPTLLPIPQGALVSISPEPNPTMAAKDGSHDTSPPNEKDVSVPGYSNASNQGPHDGAVRSDNWMTRNGLNLESFKKRDYGTGIVELDRTMKPRHLQMIAIGGSIGAGFFVGSGSALSKGGPGSLLIDFLIIGVMMFNVVYALGELAVMYPASIQSMRSPRKGN
jgi:hypothetical protein